MKRLLSLFVAILATTALWAYDFKYGDLYYNITGTNTVEVTSRYNNKSFNRRVKLSSVVIPKTVTYKGTVYHVVGIGGGAFNGCSSLTSIVIQNSVTSIGDWAFGGCSSLTSITIPNSVTSIGIGTFSICSSLTSITIPNSVTSIGDWAFLGCFSLTSITIPNSLTSIGSGTFSICSSLTSVSIPNSVTSIGWVAFRDCSSLKSVTIPNSVTSIGDEAFHNCSLLNSITIPNGVTSIGDWAFHGCKSLKKINYAGTEAQWNNITKGNNWSDNTPATIICSAKPATSSQTNMHNGHEYVDLGLPSGLKWAICNVGANAPEEYGDYFAWGETQPKETNYWTTYKWCNGSMDTQTKYCTNSIYGTVDNKTVLDKDDDAAAVNWGGAWRMPTYAELTELCTECTWIWTTQNGVNGYTVIGPNCNSIFLPAAGHHSGSSLVYAGSRGYYWSSSLYTADYPHNAREVLFLSDRVDRWCVDVRCYGNSVRPVCQ